MIIKIIIVIPITNPKNPVGVFSIFAITTIKLNVYVNSVNGIPKFCDSPNTTDKRKTPTVNPIPTRNTLFALS